jgi:hypothetical protein
VILTSATLRTGGTFEYVRDRLSTQDVEEAVVGSPFDYERSTLVYIPTDMPDPSRRDDYQRAVERGLIELAAATRGRLLGLFTSYAQLRQTAQAITPRLALGNITVFDQRMGRAVRRCSMALSARSARCCSVRARFGKADARPGFERGGDRTCVCRAQRSGVCRALGTL